MAPKPVLGVAPPEIRRPAPSPFRAVDQRWGFSFRYWRQIKHFGLDHSEPKWFVSLLEKLQTLSSENIDNFIGDIRKKDNYRYHIINWNAKNIPIQRKDLNWLHQDYLNNEEDYPLVQFQVSKALGRIVGFFDENRIFNIVLLDPLHNIQPTKSHNYRVDQCNPLRCEYTHMKLSLEELAENNDCQKQSCNLVAGIKSIYNFRLKHPNVLVLHIGDVDISEADKAISDGKFTSYAEIFQTGVHLYDS